MVKFMAAAMKKLGYDEVVDDGMATCSRIGDARASPSTAIATPWTPATPACGPRSSPIRRQSRRQGLRRAPL